MKRPQYLERPEITPAERGLIDAVVAAPDDRAPRLVYADYLLARTEPEVRARGELIATQCKLDDLLHDAPADLRTREHELLDRYGRTWTAWLGFAGPRWNVEFRGGFMEYVDLHATNLAIASRLFTTEPVRRLVIEEPTRDATKLLEMVWLARLHTFGVRAAVYGLAPQAVVMSPHLANITGLVLEYSSLAEIDLGHLVGLRELSVARNRFSTVDAFAALPLRTLDLSNNPIDVTSVTKLCAMQLERLDVRNCPISADGIERLRERYGHALLT
ncbi:MAG: TIGR02996 domain-containing protein [Kofleriaceae bacterium]